MLFQLESLEMRQLLSASPIAKFSASTFYFNDIQASASGGPGASPAQSLKISNTGSASLSVTSIKLGGANASEFTSSSTGGLTISAGSSKTVSLAFNAKALGIQTATLTITTNDSAHKSTT